MQSPSNVLEPTSVRREREAKQRHRQLEQIVAYRLPTDTRAAENQRNALRRRTGHLPPLSFAFLVSLWRHNLMGPSCEFKCSLARIGADLKPRRQAETDKVSRVALTEAGRQLCNLGLISRRQRREDESAFWRLRLGDLPRRALSQSTRAEIEWMLPQGLSAQEVAIYVYLRAAQGDRQALVCTQRRMEGITGCDRHSVMGLLNRLGRLTKTSERDRNAVLYSIDLAVELPPLRDESGLY